jgi:phage terminase large subunit-like protein
LIKRYLLNKNLFVEDDIEAVPQGIRLSPIFKEFERKLLLNKVCFAGNQMLIRHMTNISIKEMNGTSNNIQIRKLSEKSRIDGFMAMLFAASLLVDFSDRKNDYNMKVLNI